MSIKSTIDAVLSSSDNLLNFIRKKVTGREVCGIVIPSQQSILLSPLNSSSISYAEYSDFQYQSLPRRLLFQITRNITTACSLETSQDLPLPNNFEHSIKLIGKDYIPYGYILFSKSKKSIVVGFTGTENLTEWISDARYIQVFPENISGADENVLVHSGFYEIYTQISNQIRKIINEAQSSYDSLYIAGYSMGGGIAQICAMDLSEYNPKLYTFASPRVFNPSGAKLLNKLVPKHKRILNSEDLVPLLPLSVMSNPIDYTILYYYEHAGKAVTFSTNLENYVENHTIAYSQKYMAKPIDFDDSYKWQI